MIHQPFILTVGERQAAMIKSVAQISAPEVSKVNRKAGIDSVPPAVNDSSARESQSDQTEPKRDDADPQLLNNQFMFY
jgi:hypothetical protein